MPLEFKKAVRRALPMQLGMSAPSGGGKTLSALLVAAGLAGPDGKVIVIDTERGRASLYSDNKRVRAALPQGYDVIEIEQPYHPKHFIEAIGMCERAGYAVCILDNESDSWNGPGGCEDIAEADKGRWNNAKKWNKRMKIAIALSDMHFIELFKAQEKSKIIDKRVSASGKEEVLNLGVLPVCEKNAIFPLLLHFAIDPISHLATEKKHFEELAHFFGTPKLLTKEDGEKLRDWNAGGLVLDEGEQAGKRAAAAAECGYKAYEDHFKALTPRLKKILIDSGTHDKNKERAILADAEAAAAEIPHEDAEGEAA